MLEPVKRSWGQYTVLYEGQQFKVKKLEFEVGKMLSLQKHFNREEFWMFTKGTGLMTITTDYQRAWKPPTEVEAGEFVYINKERWHSFVATEPTEVIELQLGRCEEDDIIRREQPEWAPK
jgi:mannose-6-phosphate isomerase-like protein (cupin superfamily)